MRCLQVIDRLYTGGAERIAVDLTNELNDSGIYCDLLVLRKEGNLRQEVKHDHLLDLDRKAKFSLKKLKKIANICDKYDIIHVHLTYNFKYVLLSQKIFRFKAKVLLHDHYGDHNIKNRKDILLKYVLKPKYVLGVDSKLVDWARDYLHIPEKHLYLVRNSVKINVVEGTGKQGELNWVVVSNIRRTKHIEFAIDLALKFNAKITIYGLPTDLNYYKELSELSEGNVRFVTDCENVQSYLHQYNLALHTSKSESGPLSVLEYIGHSLPFLAYNSGEVIKEVKKQIPDFVMDDFNMEGWIQRINKIRSNQRVYESGLEKLSQDFSFQNYIKRCQQIYTEILSS